MIGSAAAVERLESGIDARQKAGPVTDDLVTKRAEDIRRIAQRHGAIRVRVFGSRAEGTSGPSSDLDVLVELEPRRDLLDLIGLKQDLEKLLGCRVDVVEEGGLSPYLRDRILRQARSL
ncbi:MAG: nucleotidyltransferase family protein [Candidatus Rokubacteria bacterium]|nr:nucleotidyltransferase family protein [Candidatus Rokubacteria bacterium]